MSEDTHKRLNYLFMPYAMRAVDKLRQKKGRFAHYTSASVALQIIDKKIVWMRNAVLMNDFSEIQHGQTCLLSSWHDDDAGGRLRILLDRLKSGLDKEVAQQFDSRIYDRRVQSYITSVSLHGGRALDEDKYGRLSMWRAYGGKTNVALIMKSDPFVTESNALNAFTSPVKYCDKEGFKADFVSFVKGLEESFDVLQKVGSDEVLKYLIWAFHFAVVSTKHPGFEEEDEWRVIHSPTLFPSERILFDIENVDGVPQHVYKLELKNYPDEGLVGATLPELLDEIIIGPTESPWPIYEALVTKLKENHVENAENKVRLSDIPLRR